MKSTILIVEDDPVQRRLLEATVERLGYDSQCCVNGQEAVEALKNLNESRIAAMVLDLQMPELDGHGVLKYLEEQEIDLPTIVQTAHGSLDVAIKAMRAGAFDFVVKPVSPERLKASLSDALKVARVKQSPARQIRASKFAVAAEPKMVLSTDTMNRTAEMIERASTSDIPVLIEGESGTGKELVAQSIQQKSSRANKPMITVNCGAIPENLIESILFGHEKGAFTGATEKHIGKFVEADGGTLFLDEIGDLPLNAQVKILRAIQQGDIEPVGSNKSQKVNIRLISATNKDLIKAVREGRFREDLYYRLNVFPILMPPLRNRRGDITNLVEHFIEKYRRENQSFGASRISHNALKLLERYDWPGNIRQLENAIFRALVLCDRAELDACDFPQISAQLNKIEPRQFNASLKANEPFNRVKLAPEYPIFDANTDLDVRGDNEPDESVFLLGPDGHVRQLIDIEEQSIRHAISHYNGQMSEIARRLGIGRSTLYRKLKDYNILVDELAD